MTQVDRVGNIEHSDKALNDALRSGDPDKIAAAATERNRVIASLMEQRHDLEGRYEALHQQLKGAVEARDTFEQAILGAIASLDAGVPGENVAKYLRAMRAIPAGGQ